MLKRAEEVIASGDPRAIVDFAIEVNREITQSSRSLAEVKTCLRRLARAKRVEEDLSVELEGFLGLATVFFPRSEIQTKRGMDLKDLETNLSAETFARLFTKETVVHPIAADDFEARLSDLGEADRAVLDQFVEIRPSTPKVHLTK